MYLVEMLNVSMFRFFMNWFSILRFGNFLLLI